jgi:hypothetical protein
VEGKSTTSPTLAELLRDLETFEPALKVLAKPSFIKDWKCLVSILRQNPTMAIRDFVAALEDSFRRGAEPFPQSGETLVDAFVRRLGESQHSLEEFHRVVSALETSKAIKQDEMAQIATRFAFKTAKSTPRKTSLARIKRRSDSSEAAGAKDRATKGKSAA